MEICCWDCANTEGDKCSHAMHQDCLYAMSTRGKRGKHDHYYNHFVPKEDKKMHHCVQCGKDITGSYCTCVPLLYGKVKEKPVEYKPTGKSLTARQVIWMSKITRDEASKFIDWMDNVLDFNHNLLGSPSFLPYALQHTCFRDFLLAGGYIEKVDTWVPVKMGDRFRHKDGDELMLCQVDSFKYGFICMSKSDLGNRWSEPTDVKNWIEITKKEFQKICGSIPIDELERI